MVLTCHGALYLVALVCFLVAACPTGSRVNWMCVGFAALTATLIV